jgi:hypothetical protein
MEAFDETGALSQMDSYIYRTVGRCVSRKGPSHANHENISGRHKPKSQAIQRDILFPCVQLDQLIFMAEVIKQEAQKKIELARQYYTLAEKEGFFSHFGAYNEEILRPLKNAGEFTADGVKKEILATLMLQPLDARSGFVLYNVLAFLAGVAESSIAMALGYGWFSFVWNACVGYCVAYSLYWVFLCKQMKVRSTISIVLCADA